MPMFGSQWLANAGASYELDQSIRFNSADSAYVTRTPSSTGDQKKWTTSFWFKRCKTGATDYLMTAGQTGTNNGVCGIYVHSDDTIHTYFDTTGASPYGSLNSRKFRDPSAWYHFIWAVDAVNTVQRVWVNGEELSVDAGKNPPNFAYDMNATGSSKRMSFATQAWGHATFANIYAAEIHHLDGEYITDPTSFGEYNDDGVWVPIEVTGLTYGTNGFYITGETAGDLGEDFSGNGNDFTSSGLAADDQVPDTPTLNFATLNAVSNGGNIALQDGNLLAVGVSNWDSVFATISMGKTGKWYFETRMDVATASNGYISAIHETENQSKVWSNYIGNTTATYGLGYSLYTSGSGYYTNGSATAITGYSSAPAAGDIIMCAVDLDNNKIWWGLNGTWFNSGDPAGGSGESAAIQADTDYTFGVSTSVSEDYFVNFGADSTFGGDTAAGGNSDGGGIGDFKYAVPSGFLCLCTSNLPTPAIADGSANFQTTLYTGNGTAIGSGGLAVSQSENSTFQPDFVWIKRRNSTVQHALTDAVRGVTNELNSDAFTAESTVAEGLTTFGSAGFTVGSDASYNTSAAPYVAWQWKANGSGSSNEDGSINTTATSVNTAAGISIMTYVGNATAGATIGHGLGKKPGLVIAKTRNSGQRWWVYHEDQGATKYGILELSNAFVTSSLYWNDTEPTDTLISLGSGLTNMSGINMLAYAFAEIPGFSKIGAYTGNGSSTDNAFIYTGFKPAWLMIKRTNSTSSWGISDTKRLGYNVDNDFIMADTVAAEVTYDYVDLLSNGFKIRNSGTAVGVSGSNYVYMAFAENPFGGDGVAPATAR